MAKKKAKPASSLDLNLGPDAPPSEAVASVAETRDETIVHTDYVGPDYDLGIKLPGSRDLIRPREFSPAEIGNFNEKHPEYTHWWVPAGK